jgi:hypothetical protein
VSFNNAVRTEALKIADAIVQERQNRERILKQLESTGRIYTLFDVTEIVPNVVSTESEGMFSINGTGTGSLDAFYTSSDQSSTTKAYYLDVYNEVTSSATSEVQFVIAYGNRLGSGSLVENGDSPTKAIYSQFRNILLTPGDTQFTMGDDTNINEIFVVSFPRIRMKEKLDPGNWEINVSGSTRQIRLIDDSDATVNVTVNEAGRVFNVVSGTIANLTDAEIYSPTTYYGLAYPDLGIIILDAQKLRISASFALVSGSGSTDNGVNQYALWKAISGSGYNNYDFLARNEQKINSTYYYVHVKNSEYNYSNNPTFITGSVGDLKYQDFIDDPIVYPTSVGLYNDRNELLAIAKLSQPLKKSFELEANIRVRLDF